MTYSGNVSEVNKNVYSLLMHVAKKRGFPFNLSLTAVYPSWYRNSLTAAAGTPVKLTCYGQHPCLSQDVVIVWHITVAAEEKDRVINKGKEDDTDAKEEEDEGDANEEEDQRDTEDRRDGKKDEDGESYRTNSDLGHLYLKQGLSISGQCRNFSCYSTLHIPAVAANNHTQVWCGVYTMACPGNEQNLTPAITVIVEGKHTVCSNKKITLTHAHTHHTHTHTHTHTRTHAHTHNTQSHTHTT